MIPGADKITVAPVGRIAPVAATETVGDLRQQEFQRALAGLVGKSMPAEVLSKLSDGSYLVRVAGTAARMMLPSNPQPGAELPLTLVSLNPRPTFQLAGAPQSAAIVAFAEPQLAAEPELYAPGMARPAAAGAAAPSVHPQSEPESGAAVSTLSPAGRIIGSVLGAALRAGHPQSAVVAPLPLLESAALADPVKLAAALKDAIGASGLFYESHVAEWSAGKRPLADLLREPQMQRLPGAAVGTALASDPATAQFINLQLTSQEQGRIDWQGQLWPGQHMAWQISRDGPGRDAGQDGDEPPEAPWRSALRLRFAALGEISASVVLAGGQLHIQLHAGSEQIGSLLRARAGELHSALEASGNAPASLTVDAAGADAHG
ncbi:MAG: flagellar hook-length control protein FliK [Telluria sp.]